LTPDFEWRHCSINFDPLIHMTDVLTVTKLLKGVSLRPRGPVAWGEAIAERTPGIYIVALVRNPNAGCGPVPVHYLDERDRQRWLDGQPIIYVGRTIRSLRRRLTQFYWHRYGARGPHRDGQAVKLLRCPLWVFWAPTLIPVTVERRLIAIFEHRVGQIPFANRRR
jgi:hypothetical protein